MEKIFVARQRDLLLVPFPFSDQSGKKVRPVIVLNNPEFNEYSDDYIVAGITSNLSRAKYFLPISNNDLVEGKLFSKCCIKAENILKIDNQLIIKKIGKISKKKFQEIIVTLNKIIAIDNE